MSFLSFEFLILVIVLLIAYYLIPKNNQWLLLLCGSLVFYAAASPYYLIFLFCSIGTAYVAAVYMENQDADYEKFQASYASNADSIDSQRDEKKSKAAIESIIKPGKEELKSYKNKIAANKKKALGLTLIANILILAVLKYTGFFMETIGDILGISFDKVNFILPLGISFYTFMTVSYLCDVYWGLSKAQRNFFKYALYISYFPHITSGPIDSYMDIREELYKEHSFDASMFKEGIYRIIIGLFKKLVIAARLAVYVDAVYGSPKSYGSLTLLCATLFYAFQMYCDFSGYVDMAIGISKLFGINITENFNLPYFSKSIPEYWRRWHITLGVWFRTYVFYPIIRSDMCRKLSKRLKKNHDKAFASMITTIIGLASVWVLTGLWHGASWHYVMHGVYHGCIIIISTCLAESYKIWKKKLHISDESKLFGLFQIVRTFVLVDISYILFRASSLSDAAYIMKQIFLEMSVNISEIKNAILPFTEDNTAVAYAGVTFTALGLLVICEICKYRGNDIARSHRYTAVAVMVLFTALFGVFGQSSFLYAAY